MREAYPELLEGIGRVTRRDSPRRGALRPHHRHRPEQARRRAGAAAREKKPQADVELSGRESFSPLRHFRPAARLHYRYAARSGHRIRSRGVRPRHGRSSASAPGLRGRARTRKWPARPTPSWRRRSAPSRTFTTARARATAASKPSSRPRVSSTNCPRARKAKSCSTARPSMRNPADRSPTPARSGITNARWKWPRCAARIIRSRD